MLEQGPQSHLDDLGLGPRPGFLEGLTDQLRVEIECCPHAYHYASIVCILQDQNGNYRRRALPTGWRRDGEANDFEGAFRTDTFVEVPTVAPWVLGTYDFTEIGEDVDEDGNVEPSETIRHEFCSTRRRASWRDGEPSPARCASRPTSSPCSPPRTATSRPRHTSTLATIHRGRFDDGAVTGVEIVGGVSLQRPGMLTFDVEIPADGETLFVGDGSFTGGPVPETADFDVAVRDGTSFRRLPDARRLLANVDTDGLEYAAALSSDLLELFFTRAERSAGAFITQILRSTRGSVDEPFDPPESIPSISGFVEAPTLSADGRSLDYHRRGGGRFVIYRVTR